MPSLARSLLSRQLRHLLEKPRHHHTHEAINGHDRPISFFLDDKAPNPKHTKPRDRPKRVPPRLSSAVLERFETAVLDMDEPGIAAACPLLAPLGLATQGQELYLGFARRALEAQLDAEVGDESAPAMQRLPAIYNVSAAFLRRCVCLSCCWRGRGGVRGAFRRVASAAGSTCGRSLLWEPLDGGASVRGDACYATSKGW